MNVIDIIIIACLVLSLLWGFKDGAIRQLGSLAGIIIALVMAKKFSTIASAMLGIQGEYSHIWGYVIVLVACLIVVSLVANVLRKVVSAVGLSPIDKICGGVISVVKCVVILAILSSPFNLINTLFNVVDNKHIEESVLYTKVVSTSEHVLPTINWVSDKISHIKEDGE